MTPIEKIRGEVAEIRRRLNGCDTNDPQSPATCCASLALAEDKLRLAETLALLHHAIDAVRSDLGTQFPALAEAWIESARVLAEVAR